MENPQTDAALDRRFEASLASTLAGDWGPAAQAEADDLFMRLANILTNEDFLALCLAWAVDPRSLRRLLAESAAGRRGRIENYLPG